MGRKLRQSTFSEAFDDVLENVLLKDGAKRTRANITTRNSIICVYTQHQQQKRKGKCVNMEILGDFQPTPPSLILFVRYEIC